MKRELRIQFSDNGQHYRVYVKNPIFKKFEVYVSRASGCKERISSPIKSEFTTSTLKEEIEYWLYKLKRYVIEKSHKKRSQARRSYIRKCARRNIR